MPTADIDPAKTSLAPESIDRADGQAQRGARINIVAIRQHMTGESPRVMFLHYWGVGPTQALARGLKAALDKQKH